MIRIDMQRTARRLAKAILNGFDAFFAEYKNITYGAQGRFERADWHGVQRAMRQRLSLYKQKVISVADSAGEIAGPALADRALWSQAKIEYAQLIQGHRNFEITQTFFNSVYCFVFAHEQIRDPHAFVMQPAVQIVPLPEDDVLVHIPLCSDLNKTIERVLDSGGFTIPFENKQRDIGFIKHVIETVFSPKLARCSSTAHVELLESLFFRNKAAYLVGRVVCAELSLPFVL
ncbi:MAG: bifunctional isocitrate dehydrogenase kinase/phosphatase, partial [Pseudohongiella sp.]|nr:bifunctional isocitrate dehydrogenase kinase/phosphatase [Pseudohongiella sp.]